MTYSDICMTADFCGVPIAVEGIVVCSQNMITQTHMWLRILRSHLVFSQRAYSKRDGVNHKTWYIDMQVLELVKGGQRKVWVLKWAKFWLNIIESSRDLVKTEYKCKASQILERTNVCLSIAPSMLDIASAMVLDWVGCELNSNGICSHLRFGTTEPTTVGADSAHARELVLLCRNLQGVYQK